MDDSSGHRDKNKQNVLLYWQSTWRVYIQCRNDSLFMSYDLRNETERIHL